MKHRQFLKAGAIALACGVIAGHASAQTRKDTEFVGTALVMKECIVTLNKEVEKDGDPLAREGVFGAAGGAFLAGMAGDVVTAGLNALGAALQEASREKGFSAVGNASFAFYRVAYKTEPSSSKASPGMPSTPTESAVIESVLQERASKCLILSFGNGSEPALLPQAAEARRSGIITTWTNVNISTSPSVYVEAMLQRRADGFVVRPVLVMYARALSGAPKKPLPAEIHVSFSTPSAPTGEAAATFALARIQLPPIAPGKLLSSTDLSRFTSYALPVRPTTGSPETVQGKLMAPLAEYAASKRQMYVIERLIKRAKESKQKADDIASLEDQLEDEKAKAVLLADRRDKALAAFPTNVGTTNVSARFTVVRSANQFGLAIAESLQARGKTLGAAVTASLMPKTKEDAWTSEDTNYIVAMSTVQSAQRALDVASAGGDADAIFEARIALRNAKAAANAAAAASGRSIPFGDLTG